MGGLGIARTPLSTEDLFSIAIGMIIPILPSNYQVLFGLDVSRTWVCLGIPESFFLL